MNDVLKYIQKRINTIQKKHNFNPAVGAAQIHERPDLTSAFIEFQTLMKIIKKFGSDLDINYDPAGLKKRSVKQPMRMEFVYFIRVNETTIWKVGWSHNPEKRIQSLQPAHNGSLVLVFTIPGNRKLETLIKRYLRKYKTRNMSKNVGEWFNIEHSQIEALVKEINNNGTDFLVNKTLTKQQKN